MNNLVLGFTILVSAATVCLIERGVQQRIQARTSASNEQLITTKASLQERQSITSDLQKQLLQHENAVGNFRSELKAAKDEAASATPVINPGQEGAWPRKEPYFYMAKHRLDDVKYEAITKGDKLGKTAIALFSITPEEKVAMEAALKSFRGDLNALEIRHAEKVPPSKKLDENYQELRFRLQPMTNEITALRRQFGDSIQATLGLERGGYFMERANDWLDEQDSRTRDSEATIILTAERTANGKAYHNFEYRKPNGENGSMGVTYPLYAESPVMRYKHLFGEEPLLKDAPKK